MVVVRIGRRVGGRGAHPETRMPTVCALAGAMQRFEGRALCPKRAADKPSFAWSRELLVEGPQAPRADHLWRLPLAVQLAIQRDLGVQDPDQQVEAPLIGVLEGRCRRAGRLRRGRERRCAAPPGDHRVCECLVAEEARCGHRRRLARWPGDRPTGGHPKQLQNAWLVIGARCRRHDHS